MFFVAALAAIVVALTVHEFAHAFAAYHLGDDTAEANGRLTLNPLAHLELLGFVMLLISPVGWAKPVPVNMNNLRQPRLGGALVALAGPLSNLLAALLCIIALRTLGPVLGADNALVFFLDILLLINTMLMAFNLLPIPPLDGSNVLFSLLPPRFDEFKYRLMAIGPFVLLGLIIIDTAVGPGIFSRIFSFAFGLVSRLGGLS